MFTTVTNWVFNENVENAMQNAKTFVKDESRRCIKYARNSHWFRHSPKNDCLELQGRGLRELGLD